MAVPFLDLGAQYRSLRDEILKKTDEVFGKSAFVLGEYVDEFEKNFAAYCGAKHCVAVNNGTSALHLALLALGVKPGDEVIVPAQTFIATSNAALFCGAKPVLVDVDPVTYNLDTRLLEKALTPKTRAIIPVHLYGQPADLDGICGIAKKHNIPVIEDACQAHGARHSGKRVGSFGVMSCFSFYPGKNLGAYGEGGAVVTNDPKIAATLNVLRNQGQSKRYYHDMVGYNYRMEGIQGAILNIKLKHLDGWNDRRRALAARYNEALQGTGLTLPRIAPNMESVWHLYVVLSPKREAIAKILEGKGIATGYHYPYPLHLHKAYEHLGYRAGDFPVAERIANECLSLPIFPEMTNEQQTEVIHGVQDAIGKV